MYKSNQWNTNTLGIFFKLLPLSLPSYFSLSFLATLRKRDVYTCSGGILQLPPFPEAALVKAISVSFVTKAKGAYYYYIIIISPYTWLSFSVFVDDCPPPRPENLLPSWFNEIICQQLKGLRFYLIGKLMS